MEYGGVNMYISLLLDPIMSQLNAISISTRYFFHLDFNISFLTTSNFLLSWMFRRTSYVPHMFTTYPAHILSLNLGLSP
jgi:hypothetical protein